MVLCALGGTWMRDGVAGNARLATAGTVFCGVFLQAVPFLVLGVLISGLVATFVSPDRLTRWLPRRPVGAVLTAGVAGAALPGCECASVPVARRLFGEGSAGAAALTFMLSSPAINPVVLVATAAPFRASRRWCSPAPWRRWPPRLWWVCCGRAGAGSLGSPARFLARSTAASRGGRCSARPPATISCRQRRIWLLAPRRRPPCESWSRRGSLNMWRVIC